MDEFLAEEARPDRLASELLDDGPPEDAAACQAEVKALRSRPLPAHGLDR